MPREIVVIVHDVIAEITLVPQSTISIPLRIQLKHFYTTEVYFINSRPPTMKYEYGLRVTGQ